MNLDDYSYELEGRRYLNPQVSLDEQTAFIDNLRNIQAQNNAEIAQQTYGLGTQIPSNLGGLAGGSGYFKARYQTPQTNQAIADLRAAAQLQAFNTVANNAISQAEKRYKDAYRAANVRGTNANNPDGNGGLLDKIASPELKIETNSGTIGENERIKPSDPDTVVKYKRNEVDEGTANTINQLSRETGGGELPFSKRNTYAIVYPDGRVREFSFSSGAGGSVLDFPKTFSIGGSDNIADYLGEQVKGGAKIMRGGADITALYRLAMGL